MTKKQLFEMLKNVPDDAIILVYNEELEDDLPVKGFKDYYGNEFALYSGDTD